MDYNIYCAGTYSKYRKEDLIEAVIQVRQKKLTGSEASIKFHIPRKTIMNHVEGKILDFNPTGRARALTEEEELAVVGYLKYMARSNFPLRRSEVKGLIVVRHIKILVLQYYYCILS